MKLYRIKDHVKGLEISEKEGNEILYEGKETLTQLKCKIDKCNQKHWEEAKKKVNAYEYIYTSSKMTNNICKVSPISRSYFKLHEMIQNDTLFEESNYYACIAEGPGGFIHCMNQLSKYRKISIHKIFGITLISKDRTIPYWNQNILTNPMNHIINGKDDTGNLYNYENAEFFINEINSNLCHLVTADGGFDYSEDYNSQENASYKLIYSEIYCALNIQKSNGTFIIKMFDLFTYKTIQLLYLLYNCYSSIKIYKPLTSRLSNSEKYVICSGFTGCSTATKNILKEYYNKCEKLHIEVPKTFIEEINHYNRSFVETQMGSIQEILKMIEEKKMIDKSPTKQQVQNAIAWCNTYNLPINEKCIHLK